MVTDQGAFDDDLAGGAVGADLSGRDFSGRDLSGVDFSRANLAGARFFGSNLRGATLFEVQAAGAEFACADLTGAILVGGSFERAGFGRTTLNNVDARDGNFEEATFGEASLSGAMFALADLGGARLRDADLSGCDFERAKLSDAELVGANVTRASFNGADLRRSKLGGLRCYRMAQWVGADVRELEPFGVALLCDEIRDQNFIDEFRRQSKAHEVAYRIWWLTSDCGRSVVRWSVCSFVLAGLFAAIYPFVGVDFGEHETWLSPLYFSIVTFTTLGYGDILPVTAAAQATVIVEVILGYTMLGGLLALITSKFTRRGA